MSRPLFHRIIGALVCGVWVGGFWGLVVALLHIGPTDIVWVWVWGGAATIALIAFVAGLLSGDIK